MAKAPKLDIDHVNDDSSIVPHLNEYINRQIETAIGFGEFFCGPNRGGHGYHVTFHVDDDFAAAKSIDLERILEELVDYEEIGDNNEIPKKLLNYYRELLKK